MTNQEYQRRLKGRINEQRALNSVLDRANLWPEWLISIRHSTRQEDMNGIDLVIETTGGLVNLQIKSSQRGAEAFKELHPDIPVLVCRQTVRSSQIFLAILDICKSEVAV